MSPRELHHVGSEGVDYARPDYGRTLRTYRARGAVMLAHARRVAAGILTDREHASGDRHRRGHAGYIAHRARLLRKEARAWYEAAMRVVLLHKRIEPPSAARAWVAPVARVAREDIP